MTEQNKLILIIAAIYVGVASLLLAIVNVLEKKGYISEADSVAGGLISGFWPIALVSSPVFLLVLIFSKIFDRIIPNQKHH